MDCTTAREIISARSDGEGPVARTVGLDAHLVGCITCRAFEADVTAVNRRVRLHAAEDVPDLTARIVASAPPLRLPDETFAADPARAAGTGTAGDRTRALLAAIAVAQLVVAVPALLLAAGGDAPVHLVRDLGAFDLALAVGSFAVARDPRRAFGLLPVALTLALAVSAAAVLNVATGGVSPATEAVHLLDLVGVALIWRLARAQRGDLAVLAR